MVTVGGAHFCAHLCVNYCKSKPSEDRAITDSFTTTAGSCFPGFVLSGQNVSNFAAFAALFPYRLSSVIRRGEAGRWFEISRFHYLTDQEIREAIAGDSRLERGFRIEEQTAFLIIKIASGSPYRNLDSVKELQNKLAEISVKPRHYQIDEDWYLYIFLDEFANASELSRAFSDWIETRGFTVCDGSLEIHPGSQALPFPLQGRFTWLNERGQFVVRRGELSLDDALAFFFEDAKSSLVSPVLLLEQLRKVEKQGLLNESAKVLSFLPKGQKMLLQQEEDNAWDSLDTGSVEGSRLVVFEDSQNAEAVADKTECDQSQLLLFPEQSLSEEKQELASAGMPAVSKPVNNKQRRTRKRRNRKAPG